MANIILVVYHINVRGIYHRDLKPSNFLIKRDNKNRIYLHLNDFGLAKNTLSDYERLTTTTGNAKGTYLYMAPEIINAGAIKPVITK